MYKKIINDKLKTYKDFNPYKESYKEIYKSNKIQMYPKLANYAEN
jgi:ubiquitin